MALWGISTTTESSNNRYNIPKYQSETDRNRSPWNTFADIRGWIQRRYKSTEHSGLSTQYYDEVLVPVFNLNTDGGYDVGTGLTATGLGSATPVAVFFEDPNLASPISIGAGGTDQIKAGTTGYVHVVWNENVYCSAGATVRILRSTGTPIIGTAAAAPGPVMNYTNADGYVEKTFNGQISNRISFAFSVPNTGIGTALSIDTVSGVVGVITDFYNGVGVTSSLTSDLIHNIGGAGTYLSGVGIGTTTLTIAA